MGHQNSSPRCDSGDFVLCGFEDWVELNLKPALWQGSYYFTIRKPTLFWFFYNQITFCGINVTLIFLYYRTDECHMKGCVWLFRQIINFPGTKLVLLSVLWDWGKTCKWIQKYTAWCSIEALKMAESLWKCLEFHLCNAGAANEYRITVHSILAEA